MTLLALLRHGRTAWNAEGRMTGRSDIALSPEGRAALAGCRLPAAFGAAAWHVSPLRRARETADMLCPGRYRIDERLVEMDFGSYEGRRLQDLRTEFGQEMAENEARGLDFQPPGGESPRAVQRRLQPFLAMLAEAGGRHVAIAHKSVIRCVLAQAYDWPMLGRPPVRLQWDRLQVFRLEADGRPGPERMNLPLLCGDAGAA